MSFTVSDSNGNVSSNYMCPDYQTAWSANGSILGRERSGQFSGNINPCYKSPSLRNKIDYAMSHLVQISVLAMIQMYITSSYFSLKKYIYTKSLVKPFPSWCSSGVLAHSSSQWFSISLLARDNGNYKSKHLEGSRLRKRSTNSSSIQYSWNLVGKCVSALQWSLSQTL